MMTPALCFRTQSRWWRSSWSGTLMISTSPSWLSWRLMSSLAPSVLTSSLHLNHQRCWSPSVSVCARFQSFSAVSLDSLLSIATIRCLGKEHITLTQTFASMLDIAQTGGLHSIFQCSCVVLPADCWDLFTFSVCSQGLPWGKMSVSYLPKCITNDA